MGHQMKNKNTAIAALVIAVGCQRPVNNPEDFMRLCGPQPTQSQAEDAVREYVRTEFSNHTSLTVTDVIIRGRADRRFGFGNLGERRYGWKISFYARTPDEIGKFSNIRHLLWNNGAFWGSDDPYWGQY